MIDDLLIDDLLIDDLLLLLISYANIYLKTGILYCIVLNFNIILTFLKILTSCSSAIKLFKDLKKIKLSEKAWWLKESLMRIIV